ncbi:MAG TPA: hypothetical protein VJ728_17080, partial [Candidatus Binataceae bacterium]|nr:hypothetical protein [Candidatus Binataceae bacterium]
PWAVRTQLVMQLAAPPPHDLQGDDLSEYKGVRPPFDHWSHVAEVCGQLSDRLLSACMQALRADASAPAQQAQAKMKTWCEARRRAKCRCLANYRGARDEASSPGSSGTYRSRYRGHP